MSLESHTKPRLIADSHLILPLVLIAAALLAYANSFAGVLLFDDIIRIVNEERIRRLWPPGPLLSGERPVVDLSLAINYAIGELRPWSYHAWNLAVHVLAGLTLFGVVRRTIELWRNSKDQVSQMKRGQSLGSIENRQSPIDNLIAFAVALIFLLHPLQTQSVTYIIQRGESMMGLFYLLTLYCAIRAADSPRTVWWTLASVTSCALGMGTKAVTVTAPLIVVIYDWVFLSKARRREADATKSGAFGEARSVRWPLYAGLCATWLVLWLVGIAPEVLGSSTKGSHVGFSYQGLTPLQYAATQPGVIVKYLQLALWPSPLCLDYEWPLASTWRQIAPAAIIILALSSVTIGLLWKRHWLGFVGAWFFLVLAPTSSILPIKDVIFEHRMYLPLAAIITAFIIPLGYWLVGVKELSRSSWRRMLLFTSLVIALATPLAFATHLRNREYHSELTMWQDVVAKQPANARGYVGIGVELLEAGKPEEAIPSLRKALDVKYEYADAHFNLAIALATTGRHAEAVEEYVLTTSLNPARADAWIGAAQSQSKLGDHENAAKMVLNAIRIQPGRAENHYHLGNVLADGGDLEGAASAFLTALSLNPDHHLARINLGNVYLTKSQLNQAQAQYEWVLARDPAHTTARVNLGRVLILKEQWEQALANFRQVPSGDALAIEARFGAGWALARMRRLVEARAELREALKIDPNHAGAATELARLEDQRE